MQFLLCNFNIDVNAVFWKELLLIIENLEHHAGHNCLFFSFKPLLLMSSTDIFFPQVFTPDLSVFTMSAATCLLSEENFLCSICLDVFTTPVTIPCGHNFCKDCINTNWIINRKCQCPLCKKHFDKIPELHVNIFVSEMAAQFRKTVTKKGLEQLYVKPGDVPCDVCTGSNWRHSSPAWCVWPHTVRTTWSAMRKDWT